MEILKNNIFDNNILSGVTESNMFLFPDGGFDFRLLEHKKYLAHHLDIDFENFIFQSQSHSDNISIAQKGIVNDSDALVTDQKNICINVSIADCAAILIYDREKQVIAGVHSGWRGTQKRILSKTIQFLIDRFSSNPKDLYFYLSPMASASNYEVGKEFLDYFPESVFKKNGKLYFDNHKELISQISQFNVPLENIEKSRFCTIENTNFHSFRRDGQKSGRMSAFICLK